MLPILMLVAVFWLILFRPQMKRQKEHAAMLGALQKGDVVVTRGGVIGKITGITGNTLVLELQEKVRVRVLRSYVDAKHDPASETAPDAAARAA
jgi:preprotein translocase subunit YajC